MSPTTTSCSFHFSFSSVAHDNSYLEPCSRATEKNGPMGDHDSFTKPRIIWPSKVCKFFWSCQICCYQLLSPTPTPQKKKENSSLSLFYTAKTHLRPWQCCKSITKINKFNRKVNENNQSNHFFIYCFHKSGKKKKSILISESLNQTQI